MTLIGAPRAMALARAAGAARIAFARGLRGAGLGLAMAAVPLVALAQDARIDRPVVLELYTAQGCASCPPADEMMLDLAPRDDVIALALHVDYWDYIGWVDSFASNAHTQRQQRYARRHGHSTIYTPQVVIDGTEIMEGYRVMQVVDAISQRRDRPREVEMTLTRNADGALEIRARGLNDMAPALAMVSRRNGLAGSTNAVVGTLSFEAAGTDPAPADAPGGQDQARAQVRDPFVVELVRYRPMETVEILAGENAGRTAVYANIVTEWREIGSWDLSGNFEMSIPLQGEDPVVVLVQERGLGEIVAAARLR
ncbi:MAG: DUF1223 domain-containing protein [Pararhodobacter sp.]